MFFKKLKTRLALNALALCDYEKAEKYFRKIYESGGDVQGIKHNIAVTLMAQKKYDEAEVFFLKEIEDYGESFSRLVSLGDLYYLWGKREPCLKAYSEALKESPSVKVSNLLKGRLENCRDAGRFSRVGESLNLLIEGRSLAEKGEYEKALAAFDSSFKCDGTQYQSLNEAGVILMNQYKDFSKALEYFDKAAALSDLSIIQKNRELASAGSAG